MLLEDTPASSLRLIFSEPLSVPVVPLLDAPQGFWHILNLWRTGAIIRLAPLFNLCHELPPGSHCGQKDRLRDTAILAFWSTGHHALHWLFDWVRLETHKCVTTGYNHGLPWQFTSHCRPCCRHVSSTKRCQQGICLPWMRINYLSRCVQTKWLHSRNGVWSSFCRCRRMRYCIRGVDQLQP